MFARDHKTSSQQSIVKGDMLHPFSSVDQMSAQGSRIMKRAEGVRLWDGLGNEYIDSAASLWCVNVGYGRTEIIDAMARQGYDLPFYHSFNGMGNEPALALTDKILSLAPGNMRKVFFGSSGSDANDTTAKIVWYYNNLRGKPDKKKLISRWRSYHGVAGAAGSLTGLSVVHKLFDLPGERFFHVSAPDLYREPERDAQSYADELDALIRREGPETVAAFWAEPVMGTGGVLTPPDGYFEAIKSVLDEHDILLVFDEVITGYGRLGEWFGAQHFNVAPDLIVTAKGLTSLYAPLSAVLVGDKVWNIIDEQRQEVGVFGHGFTSTAHPISAAAGLANLRIIEEEGLVEQAGAAGRRFFTMLKSAVGDHPLVGDVRAGGFMAGVELVAERSSATPFPVDLGVSGRVREAAMKQGLLVRALTNDVIAFSPPFNTDETDMKLITDRFAATLDVMYDHLKSEGHLKGW
ncbi:MAG: aminotransferase class III-fold pyridoxal phosphate-dependent enzyme [Pseudomonadota bacterium]